MPGRHVTDHQMRLFMTLRQTHPVPVAAARAGVSTATGYRLHSDPILPSHKKPTRGRRRPDPLEGIFAAEAVPLLESSPGLRAVAVWEELLRAATPNSLPAFGVRWSGAYAPGAPSMAPNRR